MINLCLLFLVIFLLTGWLFSRMKIFPVQWEAFKADRRLQCISVVAALFVIAGPVLCASRHMIGHDEPTVVSIAIAEAHGQPIYHAANAAQRYSLLYGPSLYWLYMPPLLLGHDLRLFQLWVMLPLALFSFMVWKLSSLASNPLGRTIVSVQAFAITVAQANSEWGMKGDTWLLCFSTLQLCAALFIEGFAAIGVMAICGAMMIDIKATTSVLAMLPAIFYAKRTGKALSAALSVALSLVLAGMVFLVKGISLPNYWYWLHQSSRHGLSPVLFENNLLFLGYMALPILILFVLLWRRDAERASMWLGRNRLLLLATGLASATIVVTGAKVGAGPWHCVPLTAIFAWHTCSLWNELQASASETSPDDRLAGWAAALLLACVVVGAKSLRWAVALHWHGAIPASASVVPSDVARDLRAIMQENPGKQIQMGYGDNRSYEMTWQRPLLVAYGNRYDLDADSMIEMDLAGVALPASTLQLLGSCQTQIWLIPAGGEPFSLVSTYYLGGEKVPKNTFPEAFRAEFLRSYRLTGHSRYFDLWSCAPRT